jgi:hypothetical protein
LAQDEGPDAERVNASGKVLNSVTGQPIPNLHLHMQCSERDGPGGSYDAEGDEQGAFTFVGVPNTARGVEIDGRRPSHDYDYHFNGTEKETPWIIRLIPEVSISGTVLDEKGSPIEGALVFLGRSSWSMGERLPPFSEPVHADGNGRFRIDVPQEPGVVRFDEDRYRLCAEYSKPATEQRTAYPLTCFPGVADWKAAEWIELHPGQSRDFTLRLAPVPGGAVSVTGPLPTGNLGISSVSILRVRDPDFSTRSPWSEAETVYFDPTTSTFRLAGLPPGKYRVNGSIESPGARLTGVDEVEVRSEEVTHVALLLTPDPVLRGRVRTDDGSPLEKGACSRLSVGVDVSIPVDLPDDGLFQVSLGKLGLYRLTFDISWPWHVASAKQGDRDALTEGIYVGADGGPLKPLDVVISRSVGTIGISLPHNQEGALETILLLRRVGARLKDDTYLMPATLVDGPPGFQWHRIPPGHYLVFAVMTEWTTFRAPYMEQDFLAQHKEFIKEVEVREGGTVQVQLPLLDLR